MSKLSFRARALDASKPMPVYLGEDLPDLPEYSAINRAVPQMPSGMEKEEECEHHLQRAICTGLIIPTPEVTDIGDRYNQLYKSNFKMPRQLIHMQPLALEQDVPDYDMDSSDEVWVEEQSRRLDLSTLQFEQMMDRLEKNSGQTVVTLGEAKALLKQDDDLIIAVYDYWLNKRLKTQHPLILCVKTEHRGGAASNPYVAFRRRTEKMQTRKNRKNDETSYEKMLKLRRDLSRALTLLEHTKRREKIKRENLNLSIEIFEKRFQVKDFSGQIVSELSALKTSRSAFAPIFSNQFLPMQTNSWQQSNQHYSSSGTYGTKHMSSRDREKDRSDRDEYVPRREKRQYKKRKHKNNREKSHTVISTPQPVVSSEEEETPAARPCSDTEEEGAFHFRRNKNCSYHMPISAHTEGLQMADIKDELTVTSLKHPRQFIGHASRRVGRGGRVILDRLSVDSVWANLDYTITDNGVSNNNSEFVSKKTNMNMSKNNSRGNSDNLIAVVKDNCDNIVTMSTSFDSDHRYYRRQCELPRKTNKNHTDSNFLDNEPRKEWIHFQPQTPPTSPHPPKAEVLTTMMRPDPYNLEIQATVSNSQEHLFNKDDLGYFNSPLLEQDLFPALQLFSESTINEAMDAFSLRHSLNESGKGLLVDLIDGTCNKIVHETSTSLMDIQEDPPEPNLNNLLNDVVSDDSNVNIHRLQQNSNIGLFNHLNCSSLHINENKAKTSFLQSGSSAFEVKSLEKDTIKALSNTVNNLNKVSTRISQIGSDKLKCLQVPVPLGRPINAVKTIVTSNSTLPSVNHTSTKSAAQVDTAECAKSQQMLTNGPTKSAAQLREVRQSQQAAVANLNCNPNNSVPQLHLGKVKILNTGTVKSSLQPFVTSTQSFVTTKYIDLIKGPTNIRGIGSVNLSDLKANIKKGHIISNIQDASLKGTIQLKPIKAHNIIKSANTLKNNPASAVKGLPSVTSTNNKVSASSLNKSSSTVMNSLSKTVIPLQTSKKGGACTLATRIQAVSGSQLVKVMPVENTLSSNRKNTGDVWYHASPGFFKTKVNSPLLKNSNSLGMQDQDIDDDENSDDFALEEFLTTNDRLEALIMLL